MKQNTKKKEVLKMLKYAPEAVDFNEPYPIGVTPQELLNASYGAARLIDGIQMAFFSTVFEFNRPGSADAAEQWVSDARTPLDGALSTAHFVLTLTARFLDDLSAADISYSPKPAAPPCPAALQ